MQMLEDAILPENLEKVRKRFLDEDEEHQDEREMAREHGYRLREAREEREETEARNRHERRRLAALERAGR